jgi:outer membrane murein-binding lipoprotein Lpp
MKQTRKDSGEMTLPMVILLVVLVIGGVLLLKQTMMPKQEGVITNVTELDAASSELDSADVDGMGNEMPALQNDAAAF